MASNVGIALEKDVVRAAMLVRGKLSTVEIPFNTAQPELVVAVLHEHFGSAAALSLSFGLGYLEIAHPELPPLPQNNARRVLLRDADRYFPTDSPVAVALGRTAKLAFACDSAEIGRLKTVFQKWAPVHAIVAAPNAIARALGKRGVHSGKFEVSAAKGERGVVVIEHDEPIDARRVVGASSACLEGATRISDETLGAESRFVAAVGALDCIADEPDVMLLDSELERAMRGVRQRRAWRSYGMFAIAATLLLFALNGSRTHALLVTQMTIDSLARTSLPAMAAAARLAQSEQEVALLVATSSNSHDALRVLATLSRALPASTLVQRIDWDGKEWRVDGSTDQAAAIVPKLDAQRSFSNVRMLSASTRFLDGTRTRESFSVAFRTSEPANASQ